MGLIVRAIVLGIIQGLTEYIPVSSSAHLIVVPWLLGWNDTALTSLPFDVALHLGTLVAVLVFFAGDWVRLIGAWLASVSERRIGLDPERRLAWFLVVGCIPGAIAGVLAESKIEKLFHTPGTANRPDAMLALALIMAALGGLLYLAERLARHVRSARQMRWRDSLWIGLAQALAIFPGVSRSGSTITAGLALNFERPVAARYSFLLSAPIILGAGMKSLLELPGELKAGSITGADLALFPLGFVAAAISGFFCIKFLLSYLQSHTTRVFVYYRWALALTIILVTLARM